MKHKQHEHTSLDSSDDTSGGNPRPEGDGKVGYPIDFSGLEQQDGASKFLLNLSPDAMSGFEGDLHIHIHL